jgi:hypothetical protein
MHPLDAMLHTPLTTPRASGGASFSSNVSVTSRTSHASISTAGGVSRNANAAGISQHSATGAVAGNVKPDHRDDDDDDDDDDEDDSDVSSVGSALDAINSRMALNDAALDSSDEEDFTLDDASPVSGEGGLTSDEGDSVFFNSEEALGEPLHGLPQVPMLSPRDVEHVQTHLAAVYRKFQQPFPDSLTMAFVVLDFDPAQYLDIELSNSAAMYEAEARGILLEKAIGSFLKFLMEHNLHDHTNSVLEASTNDQLCMRLVETVKFATSVVIMHSGMRQVLQGHGPADEVLPVEQRVQPAAPDLSDPNLHWGDRPGQPRVQDFRGGSSWMDRHDTDGRGDGEEYDVEAEDRQAQQRYRGNGDGAFGGRRKDVSAFQGVQGAPWEEARGGNMHLVFLPFKHRSPACDIVRHILKLCVQLNLKRMYETIVEQVWTTYRGIMYPTRMWRPWRPKADELQGIAGGLGGNPLTSGVLSQAAAIHAAQQQDSDDVLEEMMPEEAGPDGEEDPNLAYLPNGGRSFRARQGHALRNTTGNVAAAAAASQSEGLAAGSPANEAHGGGRRKKAPKKKKNATALERMNMEQNMEDIFETFLLKLSDKERKPQLWSLLLKTRTRRQVASYLRSCHDLEFERLSPSAQYKSWRNGTYCYRTRRFYEYWDPEYPLGVVASRYIARVFRWRGYLEDHGLENWTDIVTSAWDGLFRAQYSHESANNAANVIQMSHVLSGRLQFPVGELDDWQVAPHFLSRGKSGIEVVRFGIMAMLDRRFIGRLANNAEDKFGLQPAKDKLLVTVVGGNRKFSLPQGDQQSMISGEPVTVAAKRQVAVTTILAAFVGFFTEFMNFQDAQGSQERRNVWFLFQKPLPGRVLQQCNRAVMASELDALMHKQALAYAAAVRLFARFNIWGAMRVAQPDGSETRYQIMPQPIVDATKNMRSYNHPLSYALRSPDNGLLIPELPLENKRRRGLIEKYNIRMPFPVFQEAIKRVWRLNKYWGDGKTCRFTFTQQNYGHPLMSHGMEDVTYHGSGSEGRMYDGGMMKADTLWVEGVTERRLLNDADFETYLCDLDLARNDGTSTLDLIAGITAQNQRSSDAADDALAAATRGPPARAPATAEGEDALAFIADLPKFPMAPERRLWGFKTRLHGLLELSFSRADLNAEACEAYLWQAYDGIVNSAPSLPPQDPEVLEAHMQWALHIMDIAPGFMDNQTVLFHQQCLTYAMEVILYHLELEDCFENRCRYGSEGANNQYYMKTILSLAHCATTMLADGFNAGMAIRGHSSTTDVHAMFAARRFQLLYKPQDRTTALVMHALHFCERFGLRRSGLDVVRQILSPPCGPKGQRYLTCAWTKVCSIEDLVMLACPKMTAAQQWSSLLEERHNLLRYLVRGMDSQFADIHPDPRYFAFPNGLYDTLECEFYGWEHAEFPYGIVACNYIAEPMPWEDIKDLDFRRSEPPRQDPLTGEQLPAGEFYLTPYDSILDWQLQGLSTLEERQHVKCVTDALYGRLFQPVNALDIWGCMLSVVGIAGSGKSTLLNHMMQYVIPQLRGYIGNRCEEVFGLEPLLKAAICACPEMRENWNIDPSQLLLMLKGEFMIVPRKGRDGLPVTWRSPWITAGNMVPNIIKHSDELRDATVLFPYEYPVPRDQVNPEFNRMLEALRPHLLVRITKAYRYYQQRFGSCSSVWAPHSYVDPDSGRTITEIFMPKFFRDANRKLNMYTHPLSQALSVEDSGLFIMGQAANPVLARSLIEDHGLQMPFKAFKDIIEHIITERNIRRGTFKWRPDDYETVFQEYGLRMLRNARNLVYGAERRPQREDWVLGVTLAAHVPQRSQAAIRDALAAAEAAQEYDVTDSPQSPCRGRDKAVLLDAGGDEEPDDVMAE